MAVEGLSDSGGDDRGCRQQGKYNHTSKAKTKTVVRVKITLYLTYAK